MNQPSLEFTFVESLCMSTLETYVTCTLKIKISLTIFRWRLSRRMCPVQQDNLPSNSKQLYRHPNGHLQVFLFASLCRRWNSGEFKGFSSSLYFKQLHRTSLFCGITLVVFVRVWRPYFNRLTVWICVVLLCCFVILRLWFSIESGELS